MVTIKTCFHIYLATYCKHNDNNITCVWCVFYTFMQICSRFGRSLRIFSRRSTNKCMLSSLANLATVESVIGDQTASKNNTSDHHHLQSTVPALSNRMQCVWWTLTGHHLALCISGLLNQDPARFFFIVFCVIILCTSNFASIKNGRVGKISVSAKNFSSAPAQ